MIILRFGYRMTKSAAKLNAASAITSSVSSLTLLYLTFCQTRTVRRQTLYIHKSDVHHYHRAALSAAEAGATTAAPTADDVDEGV